MKFNTSSHLLTIASLAALPACALAQNTGIATIRIDPAQNRGAIAPGLYGSNHRYSNNGTGMWDAQNKRSVAAFDRNHYAAGLKELRYPGGTVANSFEWKKAIGPVESRPKMQPFSGGESLVGVFGPPQVATFGVDEAARWCEQNGVAMIYMFGIAFGTPQDAADLVEYLNSPVGQNKNGGVDWAAVRARNGHPAPYDVRNFEIANEADGPSQNYWWTAIDSDATRAKAALPLQERREGYAPEFLFGGMAKFEKQGVGTIDERGGRDYRNEQSKGDGTPYQRRVVRYAPFEAGSDAVFVGGEAWARVADIRTARGKVYQANSDGTFLFGNGVNGDIAPRGATITASYRSRRHGFVDCYNAMKAVDPTIKIYAGYESLEIVRQLGDKYPYDGVVIHPYTNGNNVPKAENVADWYHNLMLSGDRLGRKVEKYQTLIDQSVAPARRGQVHVIMTEFGALSQNQVLPNNPASSSYNSLGIGLYTAQQLLHYMRAGSPHASRHATTVGVLGPAPAFEVTPTALAYQMLTRHFGDRLIGIQTQNVPLRQTQTVYKPGVGIHDSLLPAGHQWAPKDAVPLQLPKLTAEASRDAAGHLYLVVINQDASDAVGATIEIAGWAPRGQIEVHTLGGATLQALNTPQSPNAVAIKATTLAARNGALAYSFAAHSLTTLKFSR